MSEHHEMIIARLKKAFEYQENGYAQWLAAISMQEGSVFGLKYHLRILLLTSSSPFLDGTDLEVSFSSHGVVINEDVFLETPLLQGSSMMDALNWLRSYGPLIHWQAESPF